MTDNILRSRTVVTAKVEAIYGIDSSPAASDAIEVMDLSLAYPSEMNDREIVSNTIGMPKSLIGRKYGMLTFATEIKGSGSAGDAPDADVLFEACGMLGVNVVSTKETYNFISTNFKSCTIYAYRDGLIHEFNGCRGTCKIELRVGQPGRYMWSFMGKTQDPIDGAVVSPSVDSTDPIVLVDAGFMLGGFAGVISAVDLDFGNNLIISDDANDNSGYGQVIITARDVRGSFDPQMVKIATHDFWSDWEDGTEQLLGIELMGNAGNIVKFMLPKCTVREYIESDRAGIMTLDHPFSAAENTGDDELQITYT